MKLIHITDLSFNENIIEILHILQKLYNQETTSATIRMAIAKHKEYSLKKYNYPVYICERRHREYHSTVRFSDEEIKYIREFAVDTNLNYKNHAIYNIIEQVYKYEMDCNEKYNSINLKG